MMNNVFLRIKSIFGNKSKFEIEKMNLDSSKINDPDINVSCDYLKEIGILFQNKLETAYEYEGYEEIRKELGLSSGFYFIDTAFTPTIEQGEKKEYFPRSLVIYSFERISFINDLLFGVSLKNIDLALKSISDYKDNLSSIDEIQEKFIVMVQQKILERSEKAGFPVVFKEKEFDQRFDTLIMLKHVFMNSEKYGIVCTMHEEDDWSFIIEISEIKFDSPKFLGHHYQMLKNI